jgi:potassium-transporting ATPase KdpC subunit
MKNLIISLRVYVVLTLVCGVLYTLVVTVFAQCIFPFKANGSLVAVNGKVRGSELLGQTFTRPEYFRPRPSAVSYNPLPSGATNASAISSKLRDSVQARGKEFRSSFGVAPDVAVPADMLFSSASGLDPHISPQAARLQIDRVALQRRMTALQKESLGTLVERSIEPPQLGFLGMPRVNVLFLNCRLDGVTQQ